jgi:hypothetical protein
VEEQNDKLAQFLYLLMRDHVPTGVVATLANRVVHADDEPIIMSAPELGQLAFRYANRIQPVPPDPEAEERERKASAEVFLAAAPMRVLEELSKPGVIGLSLVALAEACGWDARDDDDLTECQEVLQRLYDRGAIQRDEGTPMDPATKYLMTADGRMLLAELRDGATI